nr:uncharacterized protein K02A2.6-like [Onthophagus taurus]
MLEDLLPMSKERIEELQNNVTNDLILNEVIQHINEGWKSYNPKNVDNEIKQYYKLRDNLSLRENIIFYNDKLVIPESFRSKVLKLLHTGHSGIVKTKLRARKLFYWPNINNSTEKMIKRCVECEKYQRSCVKEPLYNHELPDLPFNKIGLDIAEYGRQNYLVTVDYLSKWIDIIPLNSKSIEEIEKKLIILFSTHGIPKQIICDNNPFNSHNFRTFAIEWNFEIKHSSPYYPKSNGLAEKAVGIAKNIIKKANNLKDIYSGLLEYRCTPVAGLKYSPSEILMSRVLRSKLPTIKNILIPKVTYKNAYIEQKQKQQRVKERYDKQSRKKPLFKAGENVTFQDVQTKTWKPAQEVQRTENPRSYNLMTEKKKIVITRNSAQIRKSLNKPVIMDPVDDVVMPSDVINTKETETKIIDTEKCPIVPNTVIVKAPRVQRSIRKPERLKDYILS